MADVIISPNMNLPVPVVGQEPGPQWAIDIDNCMALIDAHNHSPGFGVPINPNGLYINADLPFYNNNATGLRAVRFTPQASPIPASSPDLGQLYEAGVDLWYNDGAGNQIRFTQSGAIAGTPGSITGLTPPASVTYTSINETFTFQSNTNTSANLDGASITLRDLVANSHGITLSAPSSLAADYTIALPAGLPSNNANLLVTSGGTSLFIKGYDAIVGSSAQVTGGLANYTSLGAALAAASNGWLILILPGSYTENPSIVLSSLVIKGFKSSIITGNISFATGVYNQLSGFSLTGNISLDANSTGNTITNLFVTSSFVWSDLSAGNGNYCQLVQG